MANKYWVGASGNQWNGTAGTKWATTSGGVGGAPIPTSADDVFFDSNSGSNIVTFSSGAVCRSLNCTGFTGTLHHSASFTLNIGDSTPGASNIALKFDSGMTYTLGSSTSSAISFVSTSSTLQTIDFDGKNVGNLTFAGTNGNWALISNYTSFGGSAVTTLTRGHLHTDGINDNSGLTHSIRYFNSNNSNTRSLTLGTSTLNLIGTNATSVRVWDLTTTTNLTLSATSSTINMTGSQTGGVITFFASANQNYGTVNFSGSSNGISQSTIGGSNTFQNLTFEGSGLLEVVISAGTTQTVNSFFALGTVGNLITIRSNSSGNPFILSKSSGYVSCDYISLKDSTATGGASWFAGANSTDVSGNSGWIFTAPVFTETLSMTIVSNTLLTDLQTYKESLNFTILSSIFLIDLQIYKDDLNLIIISDTFLNDLQLYKDDLNLIITSQNSINDLQNYIDDLNLTIVAIVDLEDSHIFPKDTFKPIFLKRRRLIIIDSNLDIKRIINLRIKKNEPIKISLRRKIR